MTGGETGLVRPSTALGMGGLDTQRSQAASDCASQDTSIPGAVEGRTPSYQQEVARHG